MGPMTGSEFSCFILRPVSILLGRMEAGAPPDPGDFKIQRRSIWGFCAATAPSRGKRACRYLILFRSTVLQTKLSERHSISFALFRLDPAVSKTKKAVYQFFSIYFFFSFFFFQFFSFPLFFALSCPLFTRFLLGLFSSSFLAGLLFESFPNPSPRFGELITFSCSLLF